MAKTNEHATAVFWRVLEDDEVQEHLRTAIGRGREAWQRIARLPGSQVVEDKKLYDKVREAATSLARALKLLGPEPEPPKKHRGRTLAGVALTAGAVAIVLKTRQTPPRASTDEAQTTGAPAAVSVPSPGGEPVSTGPA